MLRTSFDEWTSHFSFVACVCLVGLALGCGEAAMPGSGGRSGSGGSGGSAGAGGSTGDACGNGRVDAGEDCDDGNRQRGDGCDRCVSEQVCIATHNSGRPASFGSVRIDPDLNPVSNVTLTLPFGYDDDDPEAHEEKAFGRLAGCGGPHAYAVLEEAQQIVHLAFDDGGAPRFEGALDVDQVVGVACSPLLGVVYAVSHPQPGGYLEVHSFLVEDDGALTPAQSLSATFFGYLNYIYRRARFAVHPVTGELWLTGYFRDAFGGLTDVSRTVRISADRDGVLSVAEQARDIGTGSDGSSFRFREDGRYAALTGVDGDCTAVWPVASNGILPPLDERLHACGYLWQAGDVAWFRDSEQFHVLLQEELRIGSPDGRSLRSDGGLLLATRARLMESLYDSTGLAVVRPFDGTLHVYRVGEDPFELTAIDHLDIAERGIRALTQFPCIP